MGTSTGAIEPALSLRTQGRLDGVLGGLITDLRGVIPEHEVVLSLVSATRAALLAAVTEEVLPEEVDATVRATWGVAIAAPAAAGSVLRRTGAPARFVPAAADAGVGLVQIGSDLRITAMDEEAAQVLGVSDRRLAANSALSLVEPSYRPLVETLMQRTGDGGSWTMVVPMRHNGGYRPTLVATATVSGAFPRVWACAVARVEDPPQTGSQEVAPPARVRSQDNHCLIECAVGGDADSALALMGIADEVRAALGPGPLVTAEGDRISVLLPLSGGTLDALRQGEQIAQLVRTLCESLDSAKAAEVRTDLVCVGARSSLGHLMSHDGAGG